MKGAAKFISVVFHPLLIENQKQISDDHQELQRGKRNADGQPQEQKQYPLSQGNEAATEQLAQDNCPPWHRGNENGLQETLAAVLDD